MEVSGQLHAPAALPPGKWHPVHISHEAGWAPEPVCTLLRREKSYPAVNRTRAVQPVAIPTPQLSLYLIKHHTLNPCGGVKV
jgi:hypothetical protein